MEQDEVNLQRTLMGICLQQGEQQLSGIDNDAEEFKECAISTPAELGFTREVDNQESPERSNIQLESSCLSTDSNDTDGSFEIVKEYADSLLEVKKENNSEQEEINVKSCNPSDSNQGRTAEPSTSKKHEFESDSSAVTTEQKESEKTSAEMDNISVNVISERITEISMKKEGVKARDENIFDSKASSISGNEKRIIEELPFCKEEYSNPGPSSMAVKSDLMKSKTRRKSLESSLEEAQEAFEEFNPANFGDIINRKMGYQCRQITTSGNESDYEEVSFNVNISSPHIIEVLRRMRLNHYIAEGNEDDLKMYSYCKYLFEKDYKIKVINNEGGTLCKNYPARIIVPYANHSYSSAHFDPDAYKELTMKSSGARCRDRFVTPTIFWNGKFICRSATLTVKKSAVYETATKSPPPKGVEVDTGSGTRILKHVRAKSESLLHITSKTARAMCKLMDFDAMKQYREDDKELLKYCQVLHITDLMVEDKKKKFWISVSSSEKIYQESYSDFEILQMPYPGCKFFKRYHEAGRIPDGLIFDWSRSDVNAVLKIPNTSDLELPAKEWDRYKEWDVVELTQNYLELILTYFMQASHHNYTVTGLHHRWLTWHKRKVQYQITMADMALNVLIRDMGILIHCISGWDRTPLFIALLRISLWADGLIHESLNAHEMAYLTLAYDWYLFGHNLPGRLKHREEIMHFCYKFLDYFTGEQFSATLMWNSASVKASASEQYGEPQGLLLLPFRPERRIEKIQSLKQIVLELYDEHVMRIPA